MKELLPGFNPLIEGRVPTRSALDEINRSRQEAEDSLTLAKKRQFRWLVSGDSKEFWDKCRLESTR